MIADTVHGILDRHDGACGGLMAALQDIQESFGHLPAEALRVVAERTGRSMADVFGVATFYRSFSLAPKGKHLIRVCAGTACHVRGAPRIIAEFEHRLGVRQGDTTSDGEFTLEVVNCLGACALGPVVVADGKYFSQVEAKQAADIIAWIRNGHSNTAQKSGTRGAVGACSPQGSDN